MAQKEGNTIGLLSNLQASKIGPRGNADSKQRLIISHEEKLLHSEEKQNIFGSKTQVSSQQVQKQSIK